MALYGTMRDGSKVSVQDEKHREKVILALKEFKDWDLVSNSFTYMIDLNFVSHPKYVGAEIEEGQWVGNFWNEYLYSNFLRDGNPKIEHKTVNIPPRKQHYWINGDHYYENGNFWYKETDAESNVYVRTNMDVTQIIIVYPEVILDRKKVVYSLKKSKKITTGYEELWTGIRPEDCETWNLNNETKKWELFTYKPRVLIPITDELRQKLQENKKK